MTTTAKRYRVKAPKGWPADQPPFGLDYLDRSGAPHRAIAGEISDDLPAHSVGTCAAGCAICAKESKAQKSRGWLLTQGLVEEVV